MRAWIYARSASGDATAIERQIAKLSAFAEQRGYSVVGISHEGGSGSDFNRPILNDLARLTTNETDIVLSTELSRIGRDLIKTGNFVHRLQARGVQVVTLTGSFDDKVVQTFRDLLSEYASKVRSDKIKAGLRRRKERLAKK